MKLGVEVLLEQQISLLAGKRIGLVTNHTGVDSQLRSTADLLHQHPQIGLAALFGPEHGVRGAAPAGEHVASGTDPVTGLPVYSLYGETRRPTKDMLAGIDTLVYDIQDIGVRYFTYPNTLAYCMEAAKEHGLSVVVLDRPNPLGGVAVEGGLVRPGFRSFVGLHPMPVRHGMTTGELARWFNRNIHCDLTVISMEGWRRSMWWPQTELPWVPMSPGTTGIDMATLYGGTCLIEGTTLSEGRGTAKPFEQVGAPWVDGRALADHLNSLDLPGLRCRPVYFTPTASKHKGELCHGVQIHVLEHRRVQAVALGLRLIKALRDLHPDRFQWLPPAKEGGPFFFDLLAGTDAWRLALEAGAPVSEVTAGWADEQKPFLREREGALDPTYAN